MIEFENISYVRMPSRQEYVDIIISKVFQSVNQSITLVNELNQKLAEVGTSFEGDLSALFGFGLNLSLDEAIRNSILHGNQRDVDKTIFITYSVSNSKIEISIEDEGSGFDTSIIPEKGETTSNGGRGIMLMKNFMDSVMFNEKGNKITMIKYKQTTRRSEFL